MKIRPPDIEIYAEAQNLEQSLIYTPQLCNYKVSLSLQSTRLQGEMNVNIKTLSTVTIVMVTGNNPKSHGSI